MYVYSGDLFKQTNSPASLHMIAQNIYRKYVDYMHSPRLFAHQQMEVINIFILGSSLMIEKKQQVNQINCLNIQEINYSKPKTTFISADQH